MESRVLKKTEDESLGSPIAYKKHPLKKGNVGKRGKSGKISAPDSGIKIER